MTLYALLLYAVTTSTGLSDSDRMRVVLADPPSLELVSAGQLWAPPCIEFCGVQDPQEVEVIAR